MTGPRSYTCQDCGTEGLSHGKRGKFPQRCAACKAKRARPARLCGVVCRHCNKEFHARYRSRMYCDDCLPVYKPAAERFKCKACGASFKKRGGKSYLIYCSRKCWIQHKFVPARERRQRREKIRKSIEAVSEILAPRDAIVSAILDSVSRVRRCFACMAMMPREVGSKGCYERFCSEDCRQQSRRKAIRKARSQRKGSRNHTVRAKKKGLPRQYSITLAKVGERDGWICQLCRLPVARNVHHLADLAACIDHIVPINHRANAIHGHTWDNVQLAHRKCNEIKGCTVACASLFDCMDPRRHVAAHAIDQTPPTGVGRPCAGSVFRKQIGRAHV